MHCIPSDRLLSSYGTYTQLVSAAMCCKVMQSYLQFCFQGPDSCLALDLDSILQIAKPNLSLQMCVPTFLTYVGLPELMALAHSVQSILLRTVLRQPSVVLSTRDETEHWRHENGCLC